MIISTLCVILGVLFIGKLIKIFQMLTFNGQGMLCDKGVFQLFLNHEYLNLTCKPIPTNLSKEDWLVKADEMLAEYYSEYDHLYNQKGYKSVKFIDSDENGDLMWVEFSDRVKVIENIIEQTRYEVMVKEMLKGLEFKDD